MARYPRQMRLGLAAGAVASLVAVLLLWSASDSTRGGALVVARSSGPETARLAERKPLPGQATAAAATETAATAAAQQPPATAASPTREARAQAPAPLAFPAPPVAGSPAHGPPMALAAPSNRPVESASLFTAAALRAPAAAPAPSTPPTALAVAVQPPERTHAALPGSPALVADASSPPPGATRPSVAATVPAPPLAVAPQAKREEPPSAAPAAPPKAASPAGEAMAAMPAWNVDAAAAKRYLEDIVMTFNDNASARRLNNYLVGMRVKGSLLHPVLDLQARLHSVRAQRTAWVESLQPGVLRLQALVVLQPAGDGEPQAYQLEAEFRGTREGTMLDRLNLQPERGT